MASTINALTGSGGIATTADASGILEFQNNGTTIATVSSTGIAMASGKTLTGDAVSNGKILQVISTTKTDVFSTTARSLTAVTGFSATITPSATSSKILISVNAQLQGNAPGFSSLRRGTSTDLIIGDANGVQPRVSANHQAINDNESFITSTAITFLDSPSTTSATVYGLYIYAETGTSYMNRTLYDANNANYGRFASTITVMEVAG